MHVDKLVGDEQNRCEVGQTSAETEDNGCSGSGGGGGGSSGCDCGSEENALASEGSDMASADERALTSGYCGEETHVAGSVELVVELPVVRECGGELALGALVLRLERAADRIELRRQ